MQTWIEPAPQQLVVEQLVIRAFFVIWTRHNLRGVRWMNDFLKKLKVNDASSKRVLLVDYVRHSIIARFHRGTSETDAIFLSLP